MLGALALIQKRIATALGKEVSFNEVLSAAYMEKQKMAVSDIVSTHLQYALRDIVTNVVVPQ